MTGPCPTCRHAVVHIERLRQEIEALRPQSRIHRGLRVELVRYVKARRAAKDRHKRHKRDEHRAAIRTLAVHLSEHAERRAA